MNNRREFSRTGFSRSNSTNRNEVSISAADIDSMSTTLITLGVTVVKKNPIKFSMYIIGLMICLLFQGFEISSSNQEYFQKAIDQIDYSQINAKHDEVRLLDNKYYNSKGWFGSCDTTCKKNKDEFEKVLKEYNILKGDEYKQTAEAKNMLGIFSSYGVSETKELFWQKFTAGKNYAVRSSKWDLIFMGISSMGRDENMISYAFRFMLQVLMNFTIGLFGAVVAFIWTLYALINTYGESIYIASLAAISFAMTWLFGLYFGVAGTAYVVSKTIASNMRIQDNGQRREHVE